MPPLDDPLTRTASTYVTTLLKQASSGDRQAASSLLPLVYQQLRAGGSQDAQEGRDQTLQATALVHEAYLRLVDTSRVQLWDGKWHFFAAAAESMRRILVDRARRRRRLKRGGDRQRVDLDGLELTLTDPPARLVNLRYFAGLTHEEAAEALGVSTSTADRHWSYARAWIYRRMASETGAAPTSDRS